LERVSQRLDVTRLEQPPGPLLSEQLLVRPDSRGDHRHPERKREYQGRRRPRLAPRENGRVRRAEQLGDALVPYEPRSPANPTIRGRGLRDPRPDLAVPHLTRDDEHGVPTRERLERLEQQHDVLVGPDRSEAQEDERIRRDAELLTDSTSVLARGIHADVGPVRD